MSTVFEGRGIGGGEGMLSRRLFRAAVAVRRLLSWLSANLEAEQERWFYWVPVFFGLGVAIYFALPVEPRGITAMAPVAGAIALRLVWRRGVAAAVVGGALVSLCLGLALAKIRTELVRAPILARQVGPVEVRGLVELVEPRPGKGQRITISVRALGSMDADVRPKRVRVRTPSALAGLKPGDAIRVRAILAPPAAPALPGGYDFARAAYFQGLGGVGYSMSKPVLDLEAEPAPVNLKLWAAVERVRQQIGNRVVQALPGETGAIANALITGERGGISEATNAAFRDSGLFHILSISGLHMVIMAGAAFYAIRLALALSPWLALNFPIKKWAAFGAAMAAFGYLLISGAASATVRSWIMISIMFLAIILDRPAVAMRNVALAALAILVAMPESLHDVGFQMSFAAVTALVAAYEAIRDRLRDREAGGGPGPMMRVLLFFGGIVLSTLIATIAVAPLAAYHFHKSQQFAIIANLVAIPICNILVMPAALASLVLIPFGLEALSLAIMGLGIEGMVWCARWVAAIPGSVGWIPAMAPAGFALMIGGGLWLTLWRARWRLLGVAPIAMGLAIAPMEPLPDLLVGGKDGTLVAIRGENRKLEALGMAGSHYELSRWLEHDGDSREPRAAATAAGYRCDPSGCTARVKGRLIAIPRHPAALADDCRRADVLLLRWPRDAFCETQGLVIDYFDWRRTGAQSLYIDGARTLRRSVASERGNRPWSSVMAKEPRSPAWGPSLQSRLRQFAVASGLLNGGPSPPRAEIEDEDGPVGGKDADDEL